MKKEQRDWPLRLACAKVVVLLNINSLDCTHVSSLCEKASSFTQVNLSIHSTRLSQRCPPKDKTP